MKLSCRFSLALGAALGATLFTFILAAPPGFASVGSGGAPDGGGMQGGCPSPGELAGFLVDNNLQANYSNDSTTRTSTYSFGSSVTSGNTTTGTPGLIEYCVYASGMRPLSIAPGVNGANGAAWTFTTGSGFSFVRPTDSDASNIPLDGNSRIVGTAIWKTLPTVQTILLHITDPVVCFDLYEKKKHDKKHDKDTHGYEDKHYDKDHGEDEDHEGEHQHDTMSHHGEHSHDMLTLVSLGNAGGHDEYSKDDHEEDSDGDHEDDVEHHHGNHDKDGYDKDHVKDHKGQAGTCFVKPVQTQTPVCDQGDATLAYNAMPFGVVNCTNPSFGFEAQSASEFGDEVQLAASTGRTLVALQVVFPSFACSVSGHWNTGDCVTTPGATFTHPITANIYAVDNSGPTPKPGALLATVTQTFTIPYRPSASGNATLCPATSVSPAGARWFNPLAGACQNQISSVLRFNFPATTLPNQVIWTVAYNTTHYGYSPIGTGAACFSSATGCPYDSLNVGAMTHPGAPYAGIDVDPNGAFVNSASGSAYCDGGTGGINILRLDTLTLVPGDPTTVCWNDNKPEGAIVTQ